MVGIGRSSDAVVSVTDVRKRSVRPLSVLHVIGSIAPRYGGPSAAIGGMARSLAMRGHRVQVITTNMDGPHELDVPLGEPMQVDGYAITYWPVQWPRSYIFSLPLARDVLRQASQVDVIHVHSLFLFHGFVARIAARRAGTPYLVRPHGTLDPYHRSRHRLRKAAYWRLIEQGNLNGAAAVHFTSEKEREHAQRLGLRAPAVVVPLGVSAPVISAMEAERLVADAWPQSAGKPLVTFLGRLTAKKGVPLVLEAFARIRANGAYLVVAGPDNEGLLAGYREQASVLGILDRVSFPGAVAGPLKEALLTRSSTFVLPSADENMGVAVLEAMAHAVPVVVTPGVALHQEVDAAGCGLVVHPDRDSLANAIQSIITQPSLARAMGQAGADLVRRCYSWDVVGRKLESVYTDVLARTGSR